ncbi:unnamed protein product [Darwinula stevensoni]|uniref:CUB domain-containing protein n=1 Tax=Darwinula stevensoni TaxID=69355 RepID=A0A7R9A2F5_9CRUS|nr:unnamed protein product [Darwinula stevensoni]CAG0888617.1 unnamed protein product [Darwinula stevensoni]
MSASFLLVTFGFLKPDLLSMFFNNYELTLIFQDVVILQRIVAAVIWDNMVASSDLIGRFCGSTSPPPIAASSNWLYIRFVTDGMNELSGFTATISNIDLPCGSVAPINVTTSVGEISSPNYPDNYPVNTRCRWVLAAPEGQQVTLTFKTMDIERSSSCAKDGLIVSDVLPDSSTGVYASRGDRPEARMIWSPYGMGQSHVYCGGDVPPAFQSIGNTVSINFYSDSGNVAKGFRVQFITTPVPGCNVTYEHGNGRIRHPGWPGESPQGIICYMTIRTPPGTRISVYPRALIIARGNNCTDSVLQFRDGVETTSPLLLSHCGWAPRRSVFSTGNAMQLLYKTPATSFHSYFDLTFTSTDRGQGCGGAFQEISGYFTSPFYPGPPNSSVDCRWAVSVPANYLVRLTFTDWAFGPSGSCDTNFMELYVPNPGIGESALFSRFCGDGFPCLDHRRNESATSVIPAILIRREWVYEACENVEKPYYYPKAGRDVRSPSPLSIGRLISSIPGSAYNENEYENWGRESLETCFPELEEPTLGDQPDEELEQLQPMGTELEELQPVEVKQLEPEELYGYLKGKTIVPYETVIQQNISSANTLVLEVPEVPDTIGHGFLPRSESPSSNSSSSDGASTSQEDERDSGSTSDDDAPPPKKRRRPKLDKSDPKYALIRVQNNQSSRKCRQKRKLKIQEKEEALQDLEEKMEKTTYCTVYTDE